jgi:hypothetical protein
MLFTFLSHNFGRTHNNKRYPQHIIAVFVRILVEKIEGCSVSEGLKKTEIIRMWNNDQETT